MSEWEWPDESTGAAGSNAATAIGRLREACQVAASRATSGQAMSCRQRSCAAGVSRQCIAGVEWSRVEVGVEAILKFRSAVTVTAEAEAQHLAAASLFFRFSFLPFPHPHTALSIHTIVPTYNHNLRHSSPNYLCKSLTSCPSEVTCTP